MVAIWSSLPSGGLDMSTPDDQADEGLGQASAGDVAADVSAGLTAFE